MTRGLGAGVIAATLAACQPAAPSRTLLFLDRAPAALVAGLSWAADPDSSRIVAWNGDLQVAKSFTSPHLEAPVAVSALGPHLLASERMGQAVVFDTGGHALREWEGHDPADVYAAAGTRIVSARSPYFVQLVAEPDTAPLLRILDTLGRVTGRIGTIHVPGASLLVQVANAGAVALDPSGAVYFAPLARDEIAKYDATGALRWRRSRGTIPAETDPVLLSPAMPELAARYAIANVALVLGPDGRLYALGGDDSGATRLRLDVLDTALGAILETRHLAPDETAVLLDRHGRLETRSAASLLAQVPSAGREPFAPAFALPDLNGDTVRLADLAGKVVLVNFWASWCDPCREEFPRMAQLYHEVDHRNFAIVAISDDVDLGQMRAFVRRFRPPFPILVGGGRMKAIYHYRGLPLSVLLDPHGRTIERIFGFGGAEEFAKLRATIANEVRNP